LKSTSCSLLLFTLVTWISTVSIINTNFDITKKQNIPGARKTTHLIFTPFMGINNISLTPEIIAALYPETLSIEPTPESGKRPVINPISESKQAAAYLYLGKNLRSICFLVDNPDHEFMNEPQMTFIPKVLTACKCSQDDIAIINIAHQEVQLPELKSQLRPKMIFLWGVSAAQIGISQKTLPELAISNVDNIFIVPVFNPERMSSDGAEGLELKQRLWASLKKLFNL
jgi:hypothetical protein